MDYLVNIKSLFLYQKNIVVYKQSRSFFDKMEYFSILTFDRHFTDKTLFFTEAIYRID